MAEKSYMHELAQWVRQQEKTKRLQDKNVVAFLAVKADVMQAMEAGYKLKTIWLHMHETGRLPSRYETFLRYVKKHIPKNSEKKQPQPQNSAPENKPTTSKPTGFAFNPTPDTKDLL